MIALRKKMVDRNIQFRQNSALAQGTLSPRQMNIVFEPPLNSPKYAYD
jgi:hypothetical protein